ncbi:MAG: hypothetical protein DHS20C19_26750 [Acidimicrobiales bacterium]|nr:MAG: hypothetical protein DHS20C19_26750 [Acidimicrobiales bacterium]
MLSIGRSAQTTPVASGGWAELLQVEERHVAKQGFGAGVLVINYGGELLRHVDEDTRAVTEAAVLAIIDRHLGWTDRAELITAGRLGVITIPIDGALTLSRRARELHRDLRECGLDIDVAYSVRRRSGGLPAAAARADAALDTALARRANGRA